MSVPCSNSFTWTYALDIAVNIQVFLHRIHSTRKYAIALQHCPADTRGHWQDTHYILHNLNTAL